MEIDDQPEPPPGPRRSTRNIKNKEYWNDPAAGCHKGRKRTQAEVTDSESVPKKARESTASEHGQESQHAGKEHGKGESKHRRMPSRPPPPPDLDSDEEVDKPTVARNHQAKSTKLKRLSEIQAVKTTDDTGSESSTDRDSSDSEHDSGELESSDGEVELISKDQYESEQPRWVTKRRVSPEPFSFQDDTDDWDAPPIHLSSSSKTRNLTADSEEMAANPPTSHKSRKANVPSKRVLKHRAEQPVWAPTGATCVGQAKDKSKVQKPSRKTKEEPAGPTQSDLHESSAVDVQYNACGKVNLRAQKPIIQQIIHLAMNFATEKACFITFFPEHVHPIDFTAPLLRLAARSLENRGCEVYVVRAP